MLEYEDVNNTKEKPAFLPEPGGDLTEQGGLDD
jgi:hypothetical protein